MAISLISGPVLADAVLPIGGAFGNEAGCAFFMTGDRSATNLAVLTPDTFTTHADGCTFERLVRMQGDFVGLKASCAPAGKKAIALSMSVEGNETEGYVVTSPGGQWGPLHRCSGTEGLFEPPGTQV